MAAGDSKGGSDLDVFEGLGKKNSTRAPASAPRTSAPPPPPPSLRQPEASKAASAPPPPPPSLRQPDGQKAQLPPPNPPPLAPPPSFTKTAAMAGVPNTSPAAFASTSAMPATSGPPQLQTLPSAGSAPRTPPPPPGRAALPPVVPPPSKSPVAASVPTQLGMSVKSLSSPPAALATAPAPPPGRSHGAGALDMDWDEEEEATHVLDREGSKADAFPAPSGGANGARPSNKQTLVGMAVPAAVPPPSARPPSLPPPPPSAAQPYARPPAGPPPSGGHPSAPPVGPPPASMRSAAPPPVTSPPAVAAAAAVAGTAANGAGAGAAFPYQTTTTPMAMPPRAGSRPAIEDAAPAMPPAPFSRSRMEQTAVLRPQPRGTGLFIAAGVGIAALVASVMYLVPKTGSIDINVADTKGGAVRNLRVSVDNKFQCESAPCQVQNIGSGSHTIKVEASGYELAVDKRVAVESGKVATIDFTLTPMAPSGGTGVKVAGSQPNEKLYVDDREIGVLPQELHDLTPGTHKVRVAAGERYAAVEKTVTVAKDEFQDLGSVTLKVLKGRATVQLATAGAKVFLVSGSDRRELPTLPMSIDLDPSKQWSLVGTKPGYTDYTLPLTFDDGQAEKSFTVTLEPKTASTSVGTIAFAPPAYSPPSIPDPAPAHPAPTPAAPSHPAATSHESAPSGGEGTLDMNSIPACSVVLDGKPIGSTPLKGFTVSAGTHSVLFVNVDQNFKKQVSVNVGAGETKKVHP